MIHVCYALRDESGRYTKFVATSMVSIFENTREFVTIHIIHDNTLSRENLEKLVQTARDYGQRVEFYNIDKLAPDRMDEVRESIPRIKNKKHWASIACFYRLMIQNFLPLDVKKIVYLDADIIVNRDISDYWNVNLGGRPLAAAPESLSGVEDFNLKKFVPVKIGRVNFKDYFNAGMFIIDLDQARKNPDGDLLSRCLRFLVANPKSTHLDQDALNFVFADNYIHLPASFNHLVNYVRRLQPNQIARESYHYIVNTLTFDTRDIFNRLWFEYFLRTPYLTPNLFERLQSMLDAIIDKKRRIADEKIQRATKISKLALERPRTFFMNPDDAKKIPNIFGLNGEELGINASASNSTDLLVQSMLESNSHFSNQKRIYFIFVEPQRYLEIRERLVAEGFQEDEDFANLDEIFSLPRNFLPGANTLVRQM